MFRCSTCEYTGRKSGFLKNHILKKHKRQPTEEEMKEYIPISPEQYEIEMQKISLWVEKNTLPNDYEEPINNLRREYKMFYNKLHDQKFLDNFISLINALRKGCYENNAFLEEHLQNEENRKEFLNDIVHYVWNDLLKGYAKHRVTTYDVI